MLANTDIAQTMLIVIMVMGGWVLWRVQSNKANNFDFSEMLRGDTGKPSAFRLAIFISLAVSTWVIMYIVLKGGTIDPWIYTIYLAVWSGAKVAESAIDAYAASKGVQKQDWQRQDIQELNSQTRGRFARFAPPQRSSTLDGTNE